MFRLGYGNLYCSPISNFIALSMGDSYLYIDVHIKRRIGVQGRTLAVPRDMKEACLFYGDKK